MSEPLPLPPFRAFLASNIPSVYDNTLSYYDELVKMIGYLETVVVPAIEKTAGEVDGIKKGLEDLKSYVDHYFDNLDVQEEINNKLDDMAEKGELTALIAAFAELNPMFVYDTLANLIDAENLIAGNTARTLGKEAANDGFGAIYKIDTTGDIALDNGLYATVVDDFGGNNYYDEITVSSGRADDTDYYVATIPLNDSDGNLIPCYVDQVADHTLSPIQYAEENFTTLTLNAGLGIQDSHDVWQQGAVIANGQIVHEYEGDIPLPEYTSYIAFKADRSIVDYPSSTTPQEMLADGVVNAFLSFKQVVENGVNLLDPDGYDGPEGGYHPLVYIGNKLDGTMVILVCDGRTNHDKGFTRYSGAAKMCELGCINAWRTDGGGSSSLVYKGSKQNRNIDENGTKDRGIWVTLNFKKETIDKELAKVDSFIGKERQLMNKQIRDDISATYSTKKAFVGLDMRTTGKNVAVDYDTVVPIKFEHSYTCNNDGYDNLVNNKVFEVMTDENDNIVAFKYNRAGLIKVTVTADIYCKNIAGSRKIFLAAGAPTYGVSAYTQVFDHIVPTANDQYHTVTATFVANNTYVEQWFYISANGQTGDDFCRIYVAVEELGTANS